MWNAILATKARAPTTVDSKSTVEVPEFVESPITETSTDSGSLPYKPVEVPSGRAKDLHDLPTMVVTEDPFDVAASISGNKVENINDEIHEQETLRVTSEPGSIAEDRERRHIISTKIPVDDINASCTDEAENTRDDRIEDQDCFIPSTKSDFLVEAKSMLHISPGKVSIENSIGEYPQAFAIVDRNTLLFPNQTTSIPSSRQL